MVQGTMKALWYDAVCLRAATYPFRNLIRPHTAPKIRYQGRSSPTDQG